MHEKALVAPEVRRCDLCSEGAMIVYHELPILKLR